MRWFWIDHFVEFETGRTAAAVKNVSLAEEHLHDHFLGFAVMPSSLVIEGLAQTGGLLVGEHYQFNERVVLAKVSRASFHFMARPGDSLTYQATMQDINENGAMVAGTSHMGDRLQAEIDLVFAHLPSRENDERELFDPADFLAMLRLLRLYDVGRQSDGSPLTIPAHLLQAEQAMEAATDLN